MFNKINNDFLQSKAFYSSNCQISAFVSMTYKSTLHAVNIDTLIYRLSFKYAFNSFAYAEIILNDSNDKKIDRTLYFNDGNEVIITITSPLQFQYTFRGQIVSFKNIDVDKNLYYMKVYSGWNYFNVYPAKVRLGFHDEEGMTFSDILRNILNYKYKYITKDKKQEILPLFDIANLHNGSINITNTDKKIKVDSFIVPNWNIEQILNYIVPFCSTENKKGNYVWYENSDGLYVTPVENIYIENKSKIFKFYINIWQQNAENENKENNVEMNVIYDYEFVSGYDSVNLKKNDAGGVNQVMYDYKNKKVIQSFKKDDELTMMKDSVRYTNINSRIDDYLSSNSIFYNKPVLDERLNEYISYNMGSEEFREFNSVNIAENAANHKITKSLFENFNLVIKTNFNPVIKLGSFITINYPSIADGGQNLKDFSGKWMVVKVEYDYENVSNVDGKPFCYMILTLGRDSKESDSGKVIKDAKTLYGE